MDPLYRAGNDIKYRLFNKNFDIETEFIEERNNYKDKCNTVDFHSKMLREIIFIFHYFNDLRQHYLISNNIEFFYINIYKSNRK